MYWYCGDFTIYKKASFLFPPFKNFRTLHLCWRSYISVVLVLCCFWLWSFFLSRPNARCGIGYGSVGRGGVCDRRHFTHLRLTDTAPWWRTSTTIWMQLNFSLSHSLRYLVQSCTSFEVFTPSHLPFSLLLHSTFNVQKCKGQENLKLAQSSHAEYAQNSWTTEYYKVPRANFCYQGNG